MLGKVWQSRVAHFTVTRTEKEREKLSVQREKMHAIPTFFLLLSPSI
jgi:hypothetical protein